MKIFDIEANGLLDTVTKIHSLVIIDKDMKSLSSNILEGVQELMSTDLLVGHNIIGYDLPVIKKLYNLEPSGKIHDTYTISQLLFPRLFEKDLIEKKIPKKLWGSHKLEAWGHRLGSNKIEYDGGWQEWSKDMQVYCEQDTLLTKLLYEFLMNEKPAEKALEIELEFQKLMTQQEFNGVPFDEQKACRLYQELEARREELHKEIQSKIRPVVKETIFIPKRDNKTRGYIKGKSFIKRKETPFNPGSRVQIIDFLKEKYSWEPKSFTDKDNPEVTEEVLSSLDYAEAPLLVEYFNYQKVISMIFKGKEAWLKHVKDGRIHGRVITGGTITGRCSHSSPNLAQVPSVRAFEGKRCRELFYAPKGYKMVGCDASGIELRGLSHYLFPYDHGSYTKKVTEGDVHTSNMEDAGLTSRDTAKTFIYAFIYGAGDEKLGAIVEPYSSAERQKLIGRNLRHRFLTKVPALRMLIDKVRTTYKSRGYLRGLDGRKLVPRSEHSALNTLIQNAGAVIMKLSTILLWEEIKKQNLYEFAFQTLNIHDENQLIVKEEYAERIGGMAKQSIIKSGIELGLKCPLDAEYKIGDNWSETH